MNLTCRFDQKLLAEKVISDELSIIPISAMKQEGIREFQLQIPIVDLQGYWQPNLRYPTNRIIWVIKNTSAAQRDFPYLTFFNSKQENRAAIALDNLRDDVEITAKMNQEKCYYEVTIQVAERADTCDYNLTIDLRRNLLWTQCLTDWFGRLNLPERHYPVGAWDPVYCSWYVVHGAVTQDWVEKTVPEAVKLGFKTLIIDDGWSYDEAKRVSPATIGTWYDSIGNWTISKAKFPDFANHVRRVQQMGMKYLVWTAPFLIGDQSELIADFEHSVLTDRHTEGCFTFDSACRDKWDILINKLTALVKDYHLDGLKIDFLDYIFPNIARSRGAETFEFITQMSQALRQVKPDALMEFRQAYATPQMLHLGTQFRAGDVPFDYTDNFARLAQIRTELGGGDGIPVHADPLYWTPGETPVNVARHLIASLGGVPMLSMELSNLSALEQQIIKFWINFYQEHQMLLNQGHWEVAYHPEGVSYMQVTRAGETVIILADAGRLPEAVQSAGQDKCYLLNLSPEPLAVAAKPIFDEAGQPVSGTEIPEGGLGMLNC